MRQRELTRKETWAVNTLQYGIPVGLIVFFFAAALFTLDVEKIFLMLTGGITLFFVFAPLVLIALCFLLAPITSALSMFSRR